MERMVDLTEKLFDEEKTVNEFRYKGDRMNASSDCKVAVAAGVRIGWVTFRECGKLLLRNMFP